jgi:vacuolar protein sorting-associated protein 13A/C
MVDDVEVTASIKQAANSVHRSDSKKADMTVRSSQIALHLADILQISTEMSDVKLSLTQRQYILLMGLTEALPRALSDIGAAADVIVDSLPDTPGTTTAPSTPLSEHAPSEPGADLGPELSITKSTNPDVWTTLDFTFSVGTIALELYTMDAHVEDDLKTYSIARFALVQSQLGFKQLSDGAMEAQFSLRTLSFSSTRSGNSVFRDIIPPVAHEGNQVSVLSSEHITRELTS